MLDLPASSDVAAAAADPRDDAYVVRSRAQIHALLAALRDTRELVVVHFGTRGEFVVTMILAVEPDRREIVLDAAPDAETNARLAGAGPLLVLAHAAGIRIQFRVERAALADYQGKPALRLPFPSAVGRFERRDCFRVRIPRNRIVVCELGPAEDPASAIARVLDLSCTGARLERIDSVPLEPGAAPPARLHLEGEPVLEIGVEIRRIGAAGSFAGVSQPVVGVRFVGLNAAAEMRIGRYLNRLQREARRTAAWEPKLPARSADS